MAQNTSSAVMASRIEPPDALDDFPTRPWATRALCERLSGDLSIQRVWEPAANRGFMVRPLREHFRDVIASDIFDYGEPDLGLRVHDFIGFERQPSWAVGVDWVFTNPPFKISEAFLRVALSQAKRGVALFARVTFLESEARWADIYNVYPPTRVLVFCERVPCHRGRIVFDGDTASFYVWLVWEKDAPRQPDPALQWIEPGTRDRLTKPGDYDHEICISKAEDEARKAAAKAAPLQLEFPG